MFPWALLPLISLKKRKTFFFCYISFIRFSTVIVYFRKRTSYFLLWITTFTKLIGLRVKYYISCDFFFNCHYKTLFVTLFFLYSISCQKSLLSFLLLPLSTKIIRHLVFLQNIGFSLLTFFPLIVSEMLLLYFTAAVTKISSKARISAHNKCLFTYVLVSILDSIRMILLHIVLTRIYFLH